MRFRRRGRWHGALAAALWAALGVACGAEPPADPGAPSAAAAAPPRLLVLVSIDTLRPDHLGLYGYERFTSPVLDGFAARGAVFDDASASAPWTLPSHASLLTGLYPMRHGAITLQTPMRRGPSTLAGLLARAGWGTAAVVSTHLLQQKQYGVTRDFGDFLYVETAPDRRAPNTWVTDQAIQWIDDAGERPTFLFVHYYDVHADYASQPEFERLLVEPYEGPADGTGWQNLRANLEPDFLELCHERFDPDRCVFGNAERPRVIDSTVQRLELAPEDVAHIRALYDAGIRQMDTELSRLFGHLDERGLGDEALVIITSDHGEEFMEHGRLDHFLPTWQETLRIPLIVVGPGVPAGTRIAEPVSNVDVVPTVLALLGLDPEPDLDGVDLSPLFSGEAVPELRTRYLHGEAAGGDHWERVLPGLFPVFRSVRQDRYKLIRESKSGRTMLFDLATDPGEKSDILDREPEIAERLLAVMRAREAEYAGAREGAETIELEDEDLDRLRALGYVP